VLGILELLDRYGTADLDRIGDRLFQSSQ
jgi:hypothetical protein